MTVREGTFYAPWPVLDGKPLNLQWGEIRSNQAELKAIARNSLQELETGVDELNALRALLGQAYGDLDFRNKYRLLYDQVTREFCLQKNDGTVDEPIWVDVWCVRPSDGQFQVVSEGGIQSAAGFYGPGLKKIGLISDSEALATLGANESVSIECPEKIFFDTCSGLKVKQIDCGQHKGSPEITFTAPFGRSQVFNASGEEWEIRHNFGSGPQLVQVMDADDRVVIPDKADVSDPNVAYFYFHDSVVGSAIIATGGTGAVELRPKDPFYLVVRTDLEPAAGNVLQPSGELIFDGSQFYVSVDEDLDDCRQNPIAEVRLLDDVFGVTVTDSENTYPSATVINFSDFSFYLSSNLNGEPVVNLTPSAGGGGVTDHGALTGLADDDHLQYMPVNASREFSADVGFGDNDLRNIGVIQGDLHVEGDVTAEAFYIKDQGELLTVTDGTNEFTPTTKINFNDGEFYLSTDLDGNPVVNQITTGDHSTLSGLDADDHPQYVLADGTRDVTGDLHIRGRTKSQGFYLTPGDAGVGADLICDSMTFQIETARVKNYWMDACAAFDYIIDEVSLRTHSGGAEVTFYTNSPATGNPKGTPVQGLTNFYVGLLKNTGSPDTVLVLNEGDEFFMGVEQLNGSVRDLVGTIKLRRSG